MGLPFFFVASIHGRTDLEEGEVSGISGYLLRASSGS